MGITEPSRSGNCVFMVPRYALNGQGQVTWIEELKIEDSECCLGSHPCISFTFEKHVVINLRFIVIPSVICRGSRIHYGSLRVIEYGLYLRFTWML